LTVNMFANEDADLEQVARVEDTSDEKPDIAPEKPQNAQLAAYLTLVQVMQERVTTTWIDKSHKQVFANQLPFAILEAIRAGLNYDEIAAAMKIGQFLGEQANQVEDETPDKPKKIMIPVEVEETSKIIGRREGYRNKARKRQMNLRLKCNLGL
jgi:hypothetical protein